MHIPNQISPLEGFETINFLPWNGLARFRKIVDRRATEISNYESCDQFLVFKGVDDALFSKLDDDESRPKGLRLSHIDDKLIVKLMPSVEHNMPTAMFTQRMSFKVYEMGLRRELIPLGDVTYKGRGSAKQGDQTFKPASHRPRESDWPTLVFECGLSESLQKLRSDAAWWLVNSEGNVNIVILLLVKPATSEFLFEQWELALSERRHTRANPEPGLVPTKVMAFGVPNDVPDTFVLDFRKVFLRDHRHGEADITFTRAELLEWAQDVWGAMLP